MSNSSNSTEELGIRLNADGVAEFVLNVNQGGKAVDDFGRKADGANKPIQTTTEKIAATGNTAKQTAAAFRLLPAQITDVVTSLASGQPAWLVAIQQGGQIKDSFGGIGPMFRELAAAVGPVRLGLMGLAGAGAVVLLAHQQGAREAQAYTRALIMNGNAAGTNASQMADMARAIAQSVGTQGKAAEAIAAMAATGEVAQRNLQGFADLAVRMERTLDQPLNETAERFTELGRAPLEASLRLNRGLNYLTASVYEEIRALMAAGREAEAGAVAQKAYADAMSSRTALVKQNLGLLESAWTAVKDAAKSSWDGMLDIGREDTLAQKLAKARSDIERFRALPNQGGGGLLGMWEESRYEKALRTADTVNRDMLRLAEKGMQDSAAMAQAQDELRRQSQARIDADLAIGLAQARAAATQKEALANRELAVAQAQALRRESLLQQSSATLENLRERDSVGLSDYYERRKLIEQQGLQSQAQVIDARIQNESRIAKIRAEALDAEIAAESRRKPENVGDLAQQQARLIELGARRAEIEVQRESTLIELRAQRGALVAQQAAAEVAATRATAAAAQSAEDQFLDAINQRRSALAQLNEQLRVSNAAATVELITDPYKRATARARLEIDELNRYYADQVAGLRQRQAALEMIEPTAAAAVAEEIQQIEQRKADAVLLINRRLVEDLKPEWQRMLEGWADTTRLMRESYDDFQMGWLRSGEDAWVQYAKTGKLNVSSLVDFAVGEFAKMAYRTALAKPMEQAGNFLANLIGLSGPAAGAAGAAGQTAAIGAETAARATLTTQMGLAVVPLNAMSAAAADAALALAAMSAAGASSGGSSLMGNLASFFSGGPGGSSGAPMALVAHSGALVGSSEGGRRAMPGVFAGARRYHSGGLAHDEVPAILQRGEGVYTKGQMKNMAPLDVVAQAVGGRGGPSVTQHISINIDARTDQAQVAQVARQAMVAAKAELMEEMARGQA